LDDAGCVVAINKSVFFDNIRDYDPKSKINVEIKESVKSFGGDDFVFRNNGVTVVSKNIDRTADRFKLEDYQIVNGCQTSNIIFDMLFGVDKAEYDDLHLDQTIAVPFRLIGSKDDDFVASIIVGTNKQNPVKEEQFWALRPFMKNFEEYARSVDPDEIIYFERRENQYRGQPVERVRIIQASIMMKALAAAILYQPHRAARDYRGISAEYDKMLFQEDHDVRVYHAACFLYYRLEFLWRNQKIDSKLKTFRFYILCAVGIMITSGQAVFNMKKTKIEKVARNMIDLSKDEEALKTVVSRTHNVIEKRLGGISAASQEKVRDSIRSESFSNEFREQMLNLRIPSIERYVVY
jgi:ribosomal protein S18